MRSLRFYYAGPYHWDGEFVLPESVFRHAIQVLRLKAGAVIQLFDGKGHEYSAELTQVAKREALAKLTVEITNQSESPLKVTLLQGISRGERMDFAIQKAVELGVQQIVPVITERCNVQLGGDRAEAVARGEARAALDAHARQAPVLVVRRQETTGLEHAIAEPPSHPEVAAESGAARFVRGLLPDPVAGLSHRDAVDSFELRDAMGSGAVRPGSGQQATRM